MEEADLEPKPLRGWSLGLSDSGELVLCFEFGGAHDSSRWLALEIPREAARPLSEALAQYAGGCSGFFGNRSPE
jgi:hypothetical protein